ncbi:MAG: flagellar basal body-associated FliL family protein [Planctomycetota bacterium]|jgi:flagellar basal body-associated protein FliL
MAEEEEVDVKSDESDSGDDSPAISKKGWLIVIVVVVLEAVFFGLLLYLNKTDPKKASSDKSEIQEGKIDSAYLGKYKAAFKELNYSIMSTSANMATLSMDIEVLLNPTREEIESEDYPTDEAMIEFQKAVNSLEPDIRDYLQSTVGSMQLQQLLKQDGKDHIKNQLKSYINERLERINFKTIDEKVDRKRITDVKIPRFILQR